MCFHSFMILFLTSSGHPNSYDSDPTAPPPPMLVSAQYHIHTHSVFRGIQVSQSISVQKTQYMHTDPNTCTDVQYYILRGLFYCKTLCHLRLFLFSGCSPGFWHCPSCCQAIRGQWKASLCMCLSWLQQEILQAVTFADARPQTHRWWFALCPLLLAQTSNCCFTLFLNYHVKFI